MSENIVQPKYGRVLLKLSGEALAGEKKIGLDYSIITKYAKALKSALISAFRSV